MPTPEDLRALAERLLAFAMTVKDEDLLQRLALRASDYLDQAMSLEAAATAASEGGAQQAEQPQPEE